MSPRLLTQPRDEMGFDGGIVSDALDMQAISRGVGRGAGAVRALSSGVDPLRIGGGRASAEAVADRVRPRRECSMSIGVDIGKTGCRVQVRNGDRLLEPVTGPGAAGLADPGGVDEALSAGVATSTLALDAAPSAAAELAALAARRLAMRQVTVSSDSIASHIGALEGDSPLVMPTPVRRPPRRLRLRSTLPTGTR